MTMTASRPGKRVSADQRAERQADQRGEAAPRQADQQRQPHDGDQRRIAGQHQVECGCVTCHWNSKSKRVLSALEYLAFAAHLAQLRP